MGKRSIVVRFSLFLTILAVLFTNLGWNTADAQVSDAEAAVYFQQIIDQNAAQAPVFGPEAGDLGFEAYEYCDACTWAAGLNLTNLHVHFDLAWPANSDLPVMLLAAIRQADPQSLGVLDSNFVTIAPLYWMQGSATGDFTTAPASVDIIAAGDRGYFGVNGELLTTFDLTGFTTPGDIVLSGAAIAAMENISLGVSNFAVWDLDVAAPEDQVADNSVPEIPGMSEEDSARFEEYRVMALFQPMVYGPVSGSLVHDAASVSFQDAGVTVTDFMAHATCSVSGPASAGVWDCGFVFKDVDADYYTIDVRSNGTWNLSEGTNEAFQSGEIHEFQIAQPQSMTIELVAVGETGYLGVNDRYVSTLDLSAITGPGTVALGSAFYVSTTIEGGTTNFSDFGVVSLDNMQGAWVGAPEVGSAVEQDVPGVVGRTYTDSTFAYSLTWDDTWSVVDFKTEEDFTEILTLTNGPVTAEVYGAFNTIGALQCVDNLVGYYQDLPGYSNVGYVVSETGEQMLRGDDDVAIGLITMTVTDEQGALKEQYDQASCVILTDGQSLVRLEQFVSPDEYLNQLDAMTQLQTALEFGVTDGAVAPEEPEGASDTSLSPDALSYQQYVDQTQSQTPVFGPALASLVPSFGPDGTWEAGISLRDIRVHADIVSQADEMEWGIMIGTRRGEDEALITDLMQDSDVILIDSDGNWETNEDASWVFTPVTSFDLVAVGDDGYLAINGEFVTSIDMTNVIGPGELVLASITEGGEESPLNLENVTVWDLAGAVADSHDIDLQAQTEPIEPDQQNAPAGDQAVYSQLLADAAAQPAAFGPESGAMVHDAEEVTLIDAGVSVTDFAAHVECQAPAGGTLPVWDCGFYFRDLAGGHFRLFVRSDGDWTFGVGMNDPIQSGEGVAALDATGAGMTIDLVVSGDTGYFAVNSNFVSTLYVAEVPGPGSVGVATGLFTDTFAVGSETGYTDFSVWSLDAPLPPEADAGPSGISGLTYTSPSFGYSLTWDETWTVNNESSDVGVDRLSISNGPVTAVLSGTTEGGPEATDCFLDLVDGYLSDPAYSNVGIVPDESGLPLMTAGEHVSSALLTFTVTQEGAPGVEIWDYVMCAKMPDTGTMVHLEQLVAPESFMHQQDDMEWLQSGLHVVPTKSVSPPGLPDLSGVVSQPTEVDISNFTQMSSTPAETTPIAGPASASLTLDKAAGNTWAAGISATDVWIRVAVPTPPSATSSEWMFQIQYRAAGFGSDSFTLNSDGAWDAGQVQGTVTQLPAKIDLVAFGETGYLAFDGTLVAMLNISTWMQPGDVILSAAQMGDIVPGSTFEVADVSVWDMNFDDVVPAGATEITYFPEDETIFADLLLQTATNGQSVFGPTSGVMNHSPDVVNFQRTEVSLSDFAARIVCLTPMTEVTWDCGFVVGNLDTAEQHRIAVVSDGMWYLSVGMEDPYASGTVALQGADARTPVTIDLIVQGDTAYLGVNSAYVATLDLSQFPGPRNLAGATAFFADTTVEGGIVLYEQFEVWSLEETQPVDIPADAEPDSSSEPLAPGSNTYLSPTFGYSLTWDDSWTEMDRGTIEGGDYLTLTNGAVYADLYSVEPYVDATSCNEGLFAYYSGDPSYSNVSYLLDATGNPLIEPGTDVATAWVSFTYTDDQGVAAEYYEFDVCMRMPDGSAMIQLELEASPDVIEVNLPAMEALAMGMGFGALDSDILDNKGGGALTEGVGGIDLGSEVTVGEESLVGHPIAVQLDEVGQTGVSGIVAVTENQDAVSLVATLIGAAAGDQVVIQAGDCSSIDAVPEYVAGSLTSTGTLTAEVDADIATLTGPNPYSVAAYARGDGQYAQPLACGVIDAAG